MSMKPILSILNEFAMPTEQMKSKMYYHGTPSEKAANSIIKQGIKPPSIKLIASKYQVKKDLIPVMGRVYITPNVSDALMYASPIDPADIEDVITHIDYFGKPDEPNVGYVFVIDGNELNQDVQPDEDMVGSVAYWLSYEGRGPEITKKIIKGLSSKAKEWFDETIENKKPIRVLLFGEPNHIIKAGKALVKIMPEEIKTELLHLHTGVAHKGKLFPIRCYGLDFSDIELLAKLDEVFQHHYPVQEFMDRFAEIVWRRK